MIQKAALTPTQQAIRNAGGPVAVGKALGITHQAVLQWDQCPPIRVIELERLSGIPRHELRPDIYPAPKAGEAA